MTTRRIIEDYLMITWRKFGLPWKEISRRLGKPPKTLGSRYGRIRTGNSARRLGIVKTPRTISKPESKRTYNAARRKCLGCGSEFNSEWEGNRLCRPCKNSRMYRSGDDYTSPYELHLR